MNVSMKRWSLEWNFKGNPSRNCSVCKDVRNLYWLVSWNSNNRSSSDRVEWIMSWGVAGGPRRLTRSSLRRGGDLPWERSGEYPCVQTLQSLGTVTGASHQELQRHLHNPDIESMIYDWITCYKWHLKLRNVLIFVLSVSLPFLLCVCFCIIPLLQWSPMFGGSRAETRWRRFLLSRSWSLARSATIVRLLLFFFLRSWV